MFTCFSRKHEESFVALVEGRKTERAASGEAVPMDTVFSALDACRSAVVQELDSAEAADTREHLRLLYEGISVMIDFLEKRRFDSDRNSKNSFDANEAVPAERGQ